jgi:hypothetical protein
LAKLEKQCLFQELRLDGNSLTRVPTEALDGPEALQNLHLQDNRIGGHHNRKKQYSHWALQVLMAFYVIQEI